MLTVWCLRQWWKWKELNQEDVRGRHGGMVSRMSRLNAQSQRKWWSFLHHFLRDCAFFQDRPNLLLSSLTLSHRGFLWCPLREHLANPGSPGRWLLNWCVCVVVVPYFTDFTYILVIHHAAETKGFFLILILTESIHHLYRTAHHITLHYDVIYSQLHNVASLYRVSVYSI